MLIRYETTTDDVIAFNRHYMKAAPEVKRSNRISAVVMGVSLATMLLTNLLLGTGYIVTVGFALYIALIFALVKFLLPGAIARRVRKQYGGEYNRGVIGAQTAKVTENYLVFRSEYQESKVAWGMIHRIESTPTHTFLYTGKMQAYILPHHAVTEGSLPAFLKALGERYRPDAKLPAPDSLPAAAIESLPPAR